MPPPPALPFYDDFGDDLAEWETVLPSQGQAGISTTNTWRGAGAARFSANPSGSFNIAATILSKTFQPAANPQMSFAYRVDPGMYARLSVDVFDGAWRNNFWSGENDEWTAVVLDLRSLATESGDFTVRFNAEAFYSSMLDNMRQSVFLDEVRLVAEGGQPYPPESPEPMDGATQVPVSASLHWARSLLTDAAWVYCSTSSTAVAGLDPGALAGVTSEDRISPGILSSGATHYWRVLCSNAFGFTTGAVWHFTTTNPQWLAVPYAQGFTSNIPLSIERWTNKWSNIRWSPAAHSPLDGGPADGGVVMEGGDAEVVYWQPGDPAEIWDYADEGGLNYRNSARMFFYCSGAGNWRLRFDYKFLNYTYNRDLNLRVDLNRGRGWEKISADLYPSGTNTNWTRLILPLGPITNQFVLRFWSSVKHSEAYAGQGLYLDNVAVEPVPTAPDPPFNPAPADGDNAVLLASALSWQNSVGTSNVDIYFSANFLAVQQQSPAACVASNWPANSWQPASLEYSTRYYWRIVARSAAGLLQPGPVWTFLTQPPPLKSLPYATTFELNPWGDSWTQTTNQPDSYWRWSPAQAAGGASPELRCEPTAGTGEIRLISPPLQTTGAPYLAVDWRQALDFNEWSTGSLFLSVQSSADLANWTNELSLQPTSDLAPGWAHCSIRHNLGATTYVAFVLSGDLWLNDGWYLDDISFAVTSNLPPPGPCYGPIPQDGELAVATNITLQWLYNPDAASVDLYFSTNQAAVASLSAESRRLAGGTAASWSPGGLEPGNTYYWRLVARNAAGLTATGAVWRFASRSAPVKELPYFTDFRADPWLESWSQQQRDSQAAWFLCAEPTPTLAGGNQPELRCQGDESTNGIVRLVSPPLKTAGLTGLELRFRQSLQWLFQPPAHLWIKIQTSADGTNWADHVIRAGGEGLSTNVVIRQAFGELTWLAWTLEGDLSTLWVWALDDVSVTPLEPWRISALHADGGFRISWPAVGGATAYTILSRTNLFQGEWTTNTTVTTNQWTDSVGGRARFYRVRAEP